jgi:CBS domain containing-hemolysin-like protein
MVINIILLLVCIVFSAFFSASETAIFSLKQGSFRKLKEKYPSAKRLNRIFKSPSFYLSTIVFGNMLVNIGLTSLATYTSVHLWGEAGVLFSIFFSGVIILLLGEVIPKTIAIHTYEKFSLFSAPLLISIARLLHPLLRVIQMIVDGLSRNFLGKEKKRFSEEELKEAIFLGKKGGHISDAEEEMISYVLEFKDTWASEIMTPRVDIKAINIESRQEEVLELLQEVRHSRFPVYINSLDNIIGVVYAKDIFLNLQNFWKDFIREPNFVPESKKIDDLLKMFLSRGERVAIVLDEYGGTAGLLTLEDIKEEIFGEIYDEFETPYTLIEKLDKKRWRAHGKIPIKTLNLELDLNVPEDADTLAGFILSRLERIPRAGEKIAFEHVEFVVERSTAKRIITILIHLK